jgi:hypothetical protein
VVRTPSGLVIDCTVESAVTNEKRFGEVPIAFNDNKLRSSSSHEVASHSERGSKSWRNKREHSLPVKVDRITVLEESCPITFRRYANSAEGEVAIRVTFDSYRYRSNRYTR